MKRLLLFIFIVTIFVLLPPVILTSKFNIPVSTEEYNNYQENKIGLKDKYSYSKYGKINILNQENGETTEMDIDEYLLGVVSAEMPVKYELEALKAQAVVARTYTIYTIEQNKHGNMTICTSSDCCQAWITKEERMEKWDEAEREENWNKINEAVYSTQGQIITYDGQVIDAFFHANSGGVTEIPSNVWGGDFPYLKSVETSGEEDYKQYKSDNTFSKDEITNLMKEYYQDFIIDWNNPDCIKISEYNESGRVRFLNIGNKSISGVEARKIFGLKSANFGIEIKDNQVYFSVIGYGHGVGMSQTGANSMAKNGANYIDIIKHFYSGVEITNI